MDSNHLAKVGEHATNFADSWEDVRICAALVAKAEEATEERREIRWEDPRTLNPSVLAAAAVKMHTIGYPLGVLAENMGESPERIKRITGGAAGDELIRAAMAGFGQQVGQPAEPAPADPQQLSLPVSEAYRAALDHQYTQGTAQLRRMLADFLRPLFLGLGSYRSRDITRFLDEVLPVTLGAQQAMARLMDAYLSARFGRQAAPLGVEATATIRGVDPDVVYQRPFTQLWTELSHGTPYPLALDHSVNRLVSLAHTDLQLTKTHTARTVLTPEDRVVGWRRIPQGPETCALCLIASTQPYSKADLAAIHPGCDCGIREIADMAEGHDPNLLDIVHEAVALDLGSEHQDYGGRASDYRKIVVTRRHGELGEVLAASHHAHTGPDDQD